MIYSASPQSGMVVIFHLILKVGIDRWKTFVKIMTTTGCDCDQPSRPIIAYECT